MEASQLLQLTIYSIVSGFVYFLVASGLTLVFGIMRIVNFAHGQFYMMAAYAVVYLFNMYHVNYLLTLLLATVGMALLGVLVEWGLFRPLRGEPFPVTMVALGLVLLVPSLALIAFGGRDQGAGSPYPGVIELLGATITHERLVIFVVGMAIMVALFLFIKYHRLGLAMRAVAQDPGAAALYGISADKTHMLAMAIGCGLAGATGALTAPLAFVNPSVGNGAVFTAFIVVILGGLGSIPGALLGGLLMGFIDNFGLRYLGAYTDMIGFAAAILVLLVRPTGFLGHED